MILVLKNYMYIIQNNGDFFILIEERDFDNIVFNMASILMRLQCAKLMYISSLCY